LNGNEDGMAMSIGDIIQITLLHGKLKECKEPRRIG
jgi:hypothetical protein